MMKTVFTETAPKAIGPYSQAVIVNGTIYGSGVLGLDPKTMTMVAGGVEEQTTQIFVNLKEILKASGSELDSVVKTTVFLKDMNDFQNMNKVYSSFMGEHRPSRSAVQVAKLPLDALVEIEYIALVK